MPSRAALGLDPNTAVKAKLEELVAAGHEIGVQVTAYLDGELVVDAWAGLADRASGRPVGGETLFNVFSVTKAITVTALHLQAERGLVDYGARVTDYWPEFGAHGKGEATVHDVITHRSGVPQMPEGVTPEDMCDWDLMVRKIADLEPVAPPGSKPLYQSMTHGWLIGEIVRRTDPKARSFGRFLQEELAEPLGATGLWIGAPLAADLDVATLVNDAGWYDPGGLYSASMPRQVALVPEVFERPDVRAAAIPAVGGVFNARSCAKVWAMLAEGGALDGVRLLSEDRVARFNQPSTRGSQPDAVMMGQTLSISEGGYWLGAMRPLVAAAKHPWAICHPGYGNSIGWADPRTRFAAAICHNRMTSPSNLEEDWSFAIAETMRAALGLD